MVNWKQRGIFEHFSKDATDGPQIDLGSVISGTVQQFWCAVPSRSHLVRIFTIAASLIEQAAQSEVGHFQSTSIEKSLLSDVKVQRVQQTVS